MTTNSFWGRAGGTARLLSVALLCVAGCFSTSDDKGPASSSGSHWLKCNEDNVCAEHTTGATCDSEGYCIDKAGKRITVSGGSAGTSGGGAGTSGGAGGGAGASGMGATGGTGGSADAGMGIAFPDCGSLGAEQGAMCTGRDDQPTPECCTGSGVDLQCKFEACTASIPGNCSGTWQPVSGSTACGGSGGYEPCAAKNCGDSCSLCDPADKTCVETNEVKLCTGTGGDCVGGAVDCAPPEACDPSGANTCGDGMACCEEFRCGPVGTGKGFCEAADPKTGGCAPCACEMQPGGCPICNSPDTAILTPTGERAIADLREGDLVLSMDHGMLVAVPILRTGQMRVDNHAVVRMVFDNGKQVEISGSHPTADGGRLDALMPGDTLGDVRVLSAELVPYTHDRTYDILPASDSGTYVAGGALIGSTLKAPGVE